MSDQVMHTPTPWEVSYGFSDWGMGCVHSIVPAGDRDAIIAEVQSVTPYCIGASAADKNLASTQRANAEFIVLAVNSHDALTARVAELESANAALMAERTSYIKTHREHEDRLRASIAERDVEVAKLRTALIVVRAAIIRAPNDIITDTVWMPEEISMNETVVDFIDATLEPEA